MDFPVQSDGLREVYEARTAMFAFARDVNTPQALRISTSSPTLQTTTDIPPWINLLGSGKESFAFQAAWRQGRPSLNSAAFAVRVIRWVM